MAIEFTQDLQLSEFKGEETVDDQVWIFKSHDNKWNQGNMLCKANKVVCCVRNPADTIASLMHFFPTLI